MMSVSQRLQKLKQIECDYEEQQELILDCLSLISVMQSELPRFACDGKTLASEYKGPSHICACTGACMPHRKEVSDLYERAFKIGAD